MNVVEKVSTGLVIVELNPSSHGVAFRLKCVREFQSKRLAVALEKDSCLSRTSRVLQRPRGSPSALAAHDEGG